MARVVKIDTKVAVEVMVPYLGSRPLDGRRMDYITNKLQEFAEGKLADDLRILKYTDEQ